MDITTQGAPTNLKKWWIAVRPWSLPASIMPVVFGTALAITVGSAQFKILLAIASFVAMVLLHCASNLLNDVFDYRKGVDVHANPISGAVVRGWITPQQALLASVWLFVAGSVIGLGLVYIAGTTLLYIGLFGLLIGILYTWSPFALKYNALGDLAVFLNFGILGALGAWVVQTGTASYIPIVWSIPMSLIVVAILHANNWRDIEGDKHTGIKTVAMVLGDTKSVRYYGMLLFAPHGIITALIVVSWILDWMVKMPLSFLLVFLSLPLAVKLYKISLSRHHQQPNQQPNERFLAMDGATAQYNLVFGALCTMATGIDVLIQKIV